MIELRLLTCEPENVYNDLTKAYLMSPAQLVRVPIILMCCFIVACGGGSSSSATNTPTLSANKAPLANAGENQMVNELTLVTLTGTGADSDGTIKSYSWKQTSTGISITLADDNVASVSFTAPDVPVDETITFELTVTDNNNATSKNTVDIKILHIELAPPTTPEPTTPTGGTLIISDMPVTAATLWAGNTSQPVGTKSIVDVEHENFDQAIQMRITNPSGTSWNGQLSIPVTADVKAGDNILLHLYFRTIDSEYETGTGFTKVLLQGPEPEYHKVINRNINSASEWIEYFVSATVDQDFTKNKLNILFELGAGDKAQTFQIAGIELFNYQQTLTLADLPNTKQSYGGREEDAPWRSEAQARIEEHRKGSFSLTLQTSDGQNINNIDIAIKMIKHAYHFGSAISTVQLMEESDDGDIYRNKVLELFNQAGPENALKWPAWDGDWGDSFNQSNTISALQWLNDKNLYTRGHVLIWPSKRNMPSAMHQFMPDDPATADPQVLDEVKAHIEDITTKTSLLLNEWDVINEPFDNHYLMDAFGDNVMVEWFEQARANLPEHKLYINDYGILSGAGLNSAHQNHYQDTIQYLTTQKAKIDGIGLQSHFSDVLTDIPKVYEIINRFHLTFPELLIRSTEFDIKSEDEILQADYTRDFMTLFFSHPSTVGIQLWGFWAGRHWFPEAAFYREDWSEKPNALVWKDLIFNQWMSSFDDKTDTEGKFSARGFYGDYTITFTHNNVERTLDFSVVKGQENNITLKLTE